MLIKLGITCVIKMLWLVKDPLYGSLRIRPFLQKGFRILSIEHKVFPDGEEYIRFLDEIREGDIYVIVLRGFPEQNNNILRGALIVDTLKDLGAEKVILVWPYIPYARQDKRFMPGEAISIITLTKVFISLGIDYLITVDVHNEKAFVQFENKVFNVTTEGLWAKYILKNFDPEKIALVAPDRGRESFVRRISQIIGARYFVFEKHRDLTTGRISGHRPINEGLIKDVINYVDYVIIIDDIIATGGTLANVASWFRKKGFGGEIIVCGTHGLFLGNAVDKLLMSGVDKIVTTDTVANPFICEELSVATLIVNKILSLVGEV